MVRSACQTCGCVHSPATATYFVWLVMCRGGGQATDWVVLGLDPACPEPDTELQLRAAVLLILTWDIRTGTGVRYDPVPCLQWVNTPCVLPYE